MKWWCSQVEMSTNVLEWWGTGSWRMEALRAECLRRGLSAARMPEEWFRAVRWTVREVADGGRMSECRMCKTRAATHVFCSTCSDSYCRSCLAVGKEELWDLSFECAGCMIETVCWLDRWQPYEMELLKLAEEAVVTKGRAYKAKTWNGYQRCMRHVIQFMRESHIWVFPVFEWAHAKGLMLFFQSLKVKGTSWATMSHYRCALASASRSAGLPNPWKVFPQLDEMSAGLSRELRRAIVRKEGLTLAMLLRILEYLEFRYNKYNGTANQRLADVALRDMGALVVGFFAIRRGAELWCNRDSSMGLRRWHVTYVRGSHVTLFIQAQKNDTTGRGSEVVVAWVTGSGVRVGEILLRLEARLDECNIPRDAPLFCPTSHFSRGGFKVPAPGTEARFQNRLRLLLKQTYCDLAADPEVLNRFSFHSLRRGGALAFQNGAGTRMVMGQGGWRSEAGVAVYLAADLNSKLTVTRCM